MKSTILDYKELVDGYVKVADWRVKEKLHRYLFGRRAYPFQLGRDNR